jgi:hypothetical protein
VADTWGSTEAFMSRRQFLARSGAVGGLGVAATILPGLLKARGWYQPAYAQNLDLVRDSLNGLVAFILPGDDPYSRAQGETADGPGGVASGATEALITALDAYLPSPVVNLLGIEIALPSLPTVPLSAAVANLLDAVTLTVNPLGASSAGAGSLILSPFSRLSMAEKARVFQLLESLQAPDELLPQPFTRVSGNLSFLAGIIPALTAYLVGNDSGAFDSATRTLTRRPVSWQISGYQPNGPGEGWDEFKGFYRGRKKAEG